MLPNATRRSASDYERSCSSQTSDRLPSDLALPKEQDYQNQYGQHRYYTPNKHSDGRHFTHSLVKEPCLGFLDQLQGAEGIVGAEVEGKGLNGKNKNCSFSHNATRKKPEGVSFRRFRQHAKALRFEDEQLPPASSYKTAQESDKENQHSPHPGSRGNHILIETRFDSETSSQQSDCADSDEMMIVQSRERGGRIVGRCLVDWEKRQSILLDPIAEQNSRVSDSNMI